MEVTGRHSVLGVARERPQAEEGQEVGEDRRPRGRRGRDRVLRHGPGTCWHAQIPASRQDPGTLPRGLPSTEVGLPQPPAHTGMGLGGGRTSRAGTRSPETRGSTP